MIGHSRLLATKVRPKLPTRVNFNCFEELQTRWNDMDAFAHLNNTLYYSYMDNAVNNHLIKALQQGTKNVPVDLASMPMRFVAESSCRFLRPLSVRFSATTYNVFTFLCCISIHSLLMWGFACRSLETLQCLTK